MLSSIRARLLSGDIVISGGDEDDPVIDAGAGGGDVSGGGDVGEMVPKAALDKLRQENADYRKQWGQYEKTFGDLPQEQREAFLALGDLYKEDPNEAAKQLANAFGLTMGEAKEALEENADSPKPLTIDDITKLLDERDQSHQQATATEQQREAIRSEAKALGFNPSAPEGSRERRAYTTLISVARDEFAGDLEQAAKALYEELDEVVRDGQKKMIAGKGEGITPVTSGDAPSGEKKITNFRDADKAAKAFLAGRA